MSSDLKEVIRTWTAQLNESRFQYTQSKIFLSSLKEIVDSGEVPGDCASKIDKVLLFGDLNEYLRIPEAEHRGAAADRALLGILENKEYAKNVKLADEEKKVVLDALRANFTQKNGVIYEIFGRFIKGGSGDSKENLKKIIHCLKTAVNSSVVWDHHNEISADIKKCYELIATCRDMLDILVEYKLNALQPLTSQVKKFNELTAQATEAKGKELLGELKTELFSDEGAEAMEIIHSKQKEVIERKKLELKILSEKVSQYENLKSEGFDDILEEYLNVMKRRKDMEKLKEDYVTGYNSINKG